MKISTNHIAIFSCALLATCVLSVFNIYKISKLENKLQQTVDKAYVDYKISTVQTQISDLGVSVNNLEYPPAKSASEVTTSTTAKNIFRREETHVGDKIAGMTVTSSTNRYVYFSGQVSLRGDVVVSDDPTHDSIQGNLYFNVAKEDWDKLPRILGDDRIVWFVFSNKIPDHTFNQSGPATITIDNYVIDSMESEVANTARLVKVNKQSF